MSLELASFLLSVVGVTLAGIALFIQTRDFAAYRPIVHHTSLKLGLKSFIVGLILALVCAVIWAIANVSLKYVSVLGADMFLFVGAMMTLAGILGISVSRAFHRHRGVPALSMNFNEISLAVIGNIGNAIFLFLPYQNSLPLS